MDREQAQELRQEVNKFCPAAMWSLRQARQYLHCSEGEVRRIFKPVKLGGKFRIPKEKIIAFCKTGRGQA